jgi:hypothetical protein
MSSSARAAARLSAITNIALNPRAVSPEATMMIAEFTG